MQEQFGNNCHEGSMTGLGGGGEGGTHSLQSS